MLILLDLSAAFDTVDYDILLKRLQDRFGVYGKALTWFSSYRSDRVQRICISGSLSEKTELEYGVPQGSVLGPYLFTMYMDPLGDVIVAHGVDHYIYADDTQLYCPMSLRDCEYVKPNLSVLMQKIKSWMSANKLKFNDDKTELIVFKKKNLPQSMTSRSITM